MAGSIREIYGTIKLKDEATKSLDKFDKSMDEAKESTIGLQDALKALGGVAVIGAIKMLAGEFINAFAELETQQIRLKNLAGEDYPELTNSIQDAIKASQGLSNEGDMSKAVNQAIKYGASVDLITGGLTQLQQLAAITGEDLASTMQGLSKDIATGSTRFIQQNPILVKHIDQFRKLGTGYDEATKKRREMFVLDLLQKESISIQKQYNETLETTNAMLAVSASQWGNIKERLGGMIMGALKPFLKLANEVLIWLGESSTGLKVLESVLIGLTPVVGVGLVWAFYALASATWAAMAPLAPFIAIGAAVVAVVSLISFAIIDLIEWVETGKSSFGALWDTLSKFWDWMTGGLLDGLVFLGELLGIESNVNIKTAQESAQASRAGGGPVSAGSPYIVGEKGLEIFTPSQSGYITPMSGGSRNNISFSVGPFYVNGPVEAAQEVENAVLRALNNLSDNIFRQETGVPIYG